MRYGHVSPLSALRTGWCLACVQCARGRFTDRTMKISAKKVKINKMEFCNQTFRALPPQQGRNQRESLTRLLPYTFLCWWKMNCGSSSRIMSFLTNFAFQHRNLYRLLTNPYSPNKWFHCDFPCKLYLSVWSLCNQGVSLWEALRKATASWNYSQIRPTQGCFAEDLCA